MAAARRLLVAAVCVWAVTAVPAWADHEPMADIFDCENFAFQEDAQSAYLGGTLLGDPSHLDDDGDGIACDHLPSRGAGNGVTPTTVGTTQTTVGTTATTVRITATTVGTTATTVGRTATTVVAQQQPLARTGSDGGSWTALAALLIATGGAFILIGRGRRPSSN